MSERITDMADKLSTPAAYTASVSTIGVGVVNWNMVAIIVGILGTILTLAMNWYFGHRRLKMEEREHNARLKQINARLKQLNAQDK